MHGAVAAGSDDTAAAGAEVLAAGGNAVDAVVAACFATAAAEPTLTSLAGGGVMLHRDGKSGQTTICDFFANAPGQGLALDPGALEFTEVQLDFGPAKQSFFIGAGSAAVPGVLPGLCQALERWGQLPLAEVIVPACRMLREGVALGPWQARAARLLEPILGFSEPCRRQFFPDGRLIEAGERYRAPAIADALEQLAALGWRRYLDEKLHPALLACAGPGAGGLLTAADLEGYEVAFRKPLHFVYRGAAVHTNPPPAVGGSMVTLMLSLLGRVEIDAVQRGTPEHVRILAQLMRVADEARKHGVVVGSVAHWRQRLGQLLSSPLSRVPTAPGGNNSTTHVSAVDIAGNAAAVTFSYGEGNGYLVGDTGIVMNNLMGEQDLHPQGFHRAPAGQRLATMMSPTLVVEPDGALTVLGTGGANRIRSALLQVISNLVDFRLDPEAAVAAARVHFEEGVLNAEVHQMADEGASLVGLGAPELVLFDQPNLFFGGVHLVRLAADGTLSGAGDPRRGGALRIA